MNKIYSALFFIMVTVGVLSGCTSSKSTVSKNVDLSKYEYASIINDETYRIPAELMEYEIQLFDAVEASRLKLINEYRIHEISPEQQERLLLVKYGVSWNEQVSTVTVNFIDYMTGRPVASCQGSYGLSFSYGTDLKRAIGKVAEQISDIFPK